MDEAEADRAVLAETTVFLSFSKDLPDHRQPGKVIYPLDEILLLCLLAVLAGAETFWARRRRLARRRSCRAEPGLGPCGAAAGRGGDGGSRRRSSAPVRNRPCGEHRG